MVKTVLRRVSAFRDLPVAYVQTTYRGRAQRPLFDAVETYCSFLGYPRSGHSLVGFLLDAHPEVLLAHELDVYGYLRAGFGRDQLFQLILDRAAETAREGRVQTGYEYEVPGQWQGRYRTLRVIGHKKGSQSARQLDRRPRLLEQLRMAVRVPLRFVHVTRNPYDNISSIAARAGSLEQAIDGYFGLCEMNERLLSRLGDDEVLTLRHESLIADPAATLTAIASFLGLQAEPSWLAACSEVVFDAPNRTRRQRPWTTALQDQVGERASRFSSLQGYAFED